MDLDMAETAERKESAGEIAKYCKDIAKIRGWTHTEIEETGVGLKNAMFIIQRPYNNIIQASKKKNKTYGVLVVMQDGAKPFLKLWNKEWFLADPNCFIEYEKTLVSLEEPMELGDRMKMFEKMEIGSILYPTLPVIARVDGRSFHTFTKGLDRPFDDRLIMCMQKTCEYLVAETNAKMGYTQSDEITLTWHAKNIESEIFFAGKKHKMNSVIAAMASVKFNELMRMLIPEKKEYLPVFDCRVYNVPSRIEGANAFVWRELDASRNSIQMVARAHFSHKECHEKNTDQLQEMLWQEKDINWNNLDAVYKRGTYYRRKKQLVKFTVKELAKLPEKHAARKDPNLMIERSVVEKLELPQITKIVNREQVIYDGAEPVAEN